MTDKTYRQIYHYPSLSLGTVQLNSFMQNYPLTCTHKVLDNSSLFGIEVEVEGLQHYPTTLPFWSVTDDGSLRNYGREYISRPIKGKHVEYALRLLYANLSNYPYDFSPRCSVHVHCNIRTMTPKQLWNMMMIYIIFERLLFKFVGQKRDENIHCVPLLDTNLLDHLTRIIDCRISPDNWMKYTALNLVPMNKLGTIEFRHMHGTDDVDKLMTWINLILKMKLYAYKNSTEMVENEIFHLNSNSQYRQFASNVFGEYSDMLLDNLSYSDYASFMEEGVTRAKLAFSTRSPFEGMFLSDDSLLLKLYIDPAPLRSAFGKGVWPFENMPTPEQIAAFNQVIVGVPDEPEPEDWDEPEEEQE